MIWKTDWRRTCFLSTVESRTSSHVTLLVAQVPANPNPNKQCLVLLFLRYLASGSPPIMYSAARASVTEKQHARMPCFLKEWHVLINSFFMIKFLISHYECWRFRALPPEAENLQEGIDEERRNRKDVVTWRLDNHRIGSLVIEQMCFDDEVNTVGS
jgi:hypothetical protein